MSAHTADAVDRYLNELCWAMAGTFSEQQAVRDEVRAHIRDQAAEFELQGVGADEAIERTLRDLGDPTEVGRSMRGSRGTVATRRHVWQPEGALRIERRHDRRLPRAGLTLALGATVALPAIVALAYAWPG